jgi:replicative DNA helicase
MAKHKLELSLPVEETLEREILGCCFSEDTTRLGTVRSVLEVSDFGTERHRIIFRSLCRMADHGEPLTHDGLYRDMCAHNEADAVGGIGYICELMGITYTLDANLRRAKELGVRRQIVIRSYHLAHAASDRSIPVTELIERWNAATRQFDSESTCPGDDVQSILDEAGGIEAFFRPAPGVPWGWPALDLCTGGLQHGELALLAARPSMGKTAMALNITLSAAKGGVPVTFYSYEMSKAAILKRLISLQAKVSYLQIHQADLNKTEWRAVFEALTEISELPIRIFMASGKTALALRCHAERLKHKGKLGLVIVDYIQLMHSASNAETRNLQVGECARELKNAATQLRVPFLVLSQLSRANENRPDKRPLMSDLRDSGELENHADLIAFLYRPGYYHREDETLRLTAELLLAKQRNGDTPTIPFLFRREFGRFESPLGTV